MHLMSFPTGGKVVEFVVSSAFAQATTVAMPTHQAGDLLLVLVARSSSTDPGLASGWTNIRTASRTSATIRVAYKIAESGSETSGTWDKGDSGGLCVVVLRSPTGFATPTAQSGVGDGPTTFPALAQPGVHFRCAYNDNSGWSAPAGTTKIVTGNSNKIGVASTLEHAASAGSVSTTGSGKYAAITVAINPA